MVQGSKTIKARDFSLLQDVRTGSGAHSACYGYWDSSLEVNQSGHKVNHLCPPSAQVKMSGAIPLLPLYASTTWTGKTDSGSIFLFTEMFTMRPCFPGEKISKA